MEQPLHLPMQHQQPMWPTEHPTWHELPPQPQQPVHWQLEQQPQQPVMPAAPASWQHEPQLAQHPQTAAAAPWAQLPDQQQQQPQQQQQQQQQQPARKRKRGGKKAREKRKRQGEEPVSLGFFGHVPAAPTLDEMAAANRRRTRRFFRSGGGGGPSGPRAPRRGGAQQQWGRRGQPTPKSVPPAPENATRFPYVNSDPLLTPAGPPAGAAGEPIDKLAADGLNAAALDMFGTNEGMLFAADSPSSSSLGSLSEGELVSEGEEAGGSLGSLGHGRGARGGGGGSGLHAGGAGSGQEDAEAEHGGDRLPRHIRKRLAQQEAIIAELEDENLRLRERVDLMEEELRHLRRGRPADSDAEEVASVMPRHAAAAAPTASEQPLSG